MELYDIAVIGAGPAGCMAAIKGAEQGKNVILLERNNKIGRKLLLTGHGRCNITNTATLDVFLEKFGVSGSFYRKIFGEFSNQDLIDFFNNHNLEVKEEESGRIFPITGKSKSVVNVLKRVLDDYGVKIVYDYRLKNINKKSKIFKLSSTQNQLINAHKVVIATGGASYKFTGSTGDGFTIAKSLGHHITKLKPGGVPLIVSDEWAHELKGVKLANVGISIEYGEEIRALSRGELLFTDFGIGGPVILDMSSIIVNIMDKYEDIKIQIDFKPDMKSEALKEMLEKDFQNNNKNGLRDYLKDQIPECIIDPVLKSITLDPQKRLKEITIKERLQLQETLKALPLNITGHLPLDKALVTCGGVSNKQINAQTLESDLVNGLYFAGEVIAGCGRRGGYNLQQAFSTGYVAGKTASENLKYN